MSTEVNKSLEAPQQAVETAYNRYAAEASDDHTERLWFAVLDYSRAILRGKFGIYEEDLTVDATTQVILKLGAFSAKSKFMTWAYDVIKNYALDEIRRRKARHEVPLERFEDVLLAPSAAQIDDTAWGEAVAGLDASDVELLDRVVAGQPLGEVSECLGITREAAKKRWQRLRATLQRRMQDWKPQ